MADHTHQAWAARAADLSRWAWARLVNRTDVWGGYHAIRDRDRTVVGSDGSSRPLGRTTTRPARSMRGHVVLTPAILERHFRTSVPEHVIGLHTTSPEGSSKWGAVEVDHHGPSSSDSGVNWASALAWHGRLCALGFRPLLTDSNGRGGYHLLVLFDAAAPTGKVFAFLRWLASDYAAHGLAVAPEVFPKQASILPGRYGNWLRLPGRHHTHDHWSRVWEGSRWLEGDAAIEFILGLPGDPASLMPAEARSVASRPTSPQPQRPLPPSHDDWSRRIRAYIATLPTGLGEGQHRDDHAYRLACFLSRDLALPDADVLGWLAEWDGRQAVRKGDARLREILKNAHEYGQRPLGCGRERPWRTARPAVTRIEIEV